MDQQPAARPGPGRAQAQYGPLGRGGDGPVSVAAFIAAQREQHQVPHAVS